MQTRQESFRGRVSWGRAAKKMGNGTLAAAVLLVVWELFTRLAEVNPTVLPSPTRVWLEIWRESPQLRTHALATLKEALQGFLLAAATGSILAGLADWSPGAGTAVRQLFSFLGKQPLIAITPLIAVWCGSGSLPAVIAAFLVPLPTMVLFLDAGFRCLPEDTCAILKTMGAGPVRIFLKARLPASLPLIVRALRLSIPLSLGGAAVAEFIGSDIGLGHLIMYAGALAATPLLLAALSLLFALALAGNLILSVAARIWIPWSEETQLPGEFKPKASATH